MDSDLKVVNGTEIGKKPDERMNRPDLPGLKEDTTYGKKSDEADVNPAVPGSSRHTRIIEDEESKLSELTGPGERICQETCLSKGHNATAPELRTWVPTAEPEVDIRFAYRDIKSNYIENGARQYEFHELTKTVYQIDLLPIGKGLHSLLEVPPRGNEQSEAGDSNSRLQALSH